MKSASDARLYSRVMRFAPEYVTNVLNDNFEDAKVLFLSPLMAIEYAHLVMLATQRIVSPQDAHALRKALDSISRRTCDGSRTTAPTKIYSSTSTAWLSRRAATTSPDDSTPRAAATTST